MQIYMVRILVISIDYSFVQDYCYDITVKITNYDSF